MGAVTQPQIIAHNARAIAPAASEEKKLAKAARRGDRQAFTELVQQHQQAVYGYIHARLLESADAEDLCQEVFLRVFQERNKLARTDSVRAWLFGIARNVMREHIRRLARRREIVWTELCLELEGLAENQPSDNEEVLSYLPVCLDSLGQSAREALNLKYQARLKLAQIGQKLCRSEGAVKLLMYRARQALKRCLDRKLKET